MIGLFVVFFPARKAIDDDDDDDNRSITSIYEYSIIDIYPQQILSTIQFKTNLAIINPV